MRYFSALCARMYRFSANSRATISSTAIFLSQQSRQYFSSPRGSETSLAPQSGQRISAAARFDIRPSYLARHVLLVALVEGRHDLLLEQAVEGAGVGGVHRVLVGGFDPRVDEEAVAAGVTLGPPAVADADVDGAVHRRLHAAGAAGLERLAWRVQPDVAALDEIVRHVQVVVIDEGDTATEGGVTGVAVDALQDALAAVVGRMGLAGEDDLHRPPRVVEDAGQPLRIAEHQLGPLVGREAAREADGQDVRRQQRAADHDAAGADALL